MAGIKDKLLGLYIKQFVMTGAQVFDKPAFVVFKFTGKRPVYSRQVIVPEDFLVNLENDLILKLNFEGKKLLYEAGKTFGHAFSISSRFFTIDDLQKEKFYDYVNLISKFLEGTYAAKMEFSAEPNFKNIKFKLENFICCNKNGKGFFIPIGGSAGIWAYLLSNFSVECRQTMCMGKGDKYCLLEYYFPEKESQEEEIIVYPKLPQPNFDMLYNDLNAVKTPSFCKYSFQDYIAGGEFVYRDGMILDKNGNRYFLFEIMGPYILEQIFTRNNKTRSIFIENCKKIGKKLVQWHNISDTRQLTNLLGALGFGDFLVIEKMGSIEVNAYLLPWTAMTDRSELLFIKSIIEGAITALKQKNICFTKIIKDISAGSLSVKLS